MKKFFILIVLFLTTLSCKLEEPVSVSYVRDKEVYRGHYILRTAIPVCCNDTDYVMYVEVPKEDWESYKYNDAVKLNGKNRNQFKEDLVRSN